MFDYNYLLDKFNRKLTYVEFCKEWNGGELSTIQRILLNSGSLRLNERIYEILGLDKFVTKRRMLDKLFQCVGLPSTKDEYCIKIHSVDLLRLLKASRNTTAIANLKFVLLGQELLKEYDKYTTDYITRPIPFNYSKQIIRNLSDRYFIPNVLKCDVFLNREEFAERAGLFTCATFQSDEHRRTIDLLVKREYNLYCNFHFSRSIPNDQFDIKEPEPGVCAVCLVSFSIRTVTVDTVCRHVFCASCIESWTNGNNSCPVCRHSPICAK
jgi:hypothetical protein